MAVNLFPPEPSEIYSVPGVVLGVAAANIRKPNRNDVLVVELALGSRVAGVFTSNRFAAAPVQVCRAHLAETNNIRALVVNTGIANAGTGEQGLQDAQETCRKVADIFDCSPMQVLPFSTGVIMEPLPMNRLLKGVEEAAKHLSRTNWIAASEAIMTTDTVPMATMLGFIATDVAIGQDLIGKVVKMVADASYNRITVDGDTSTNDSFVLISTGCSNARPIESMDDPRFDDLLDSLIEVGQKLSQAMVRDGEGATKFITITVEDAKNEAEALKVAYAVAHSPLVKTAFFASDPNLGRILAAVGNSKIPDLDATKVSLWFDDVLVAKNGGRAPEYMEERCRDESGRNHGSYQPWPWRCLRNRLDHRPFSRLRFDQRRLQKLKKEMADAKLEQKLERLLDRLEILLPKTEDEVDWSAPAFRWRRKQYLGMSYGVLEPIHRVALVDPDSIKNADQQKAALLRNTEQFVRGLPANNVLLTGARGTGKSSLIRACLKQFADQGLRLIEVDKEDLKDLIDIAQRIADRPEKFIVFCDDLSFEFGEGGYKALKAILDGSVASTGDNLLVYATSNRRHLMPEKMQDNLASSMDEDGELRPAETIEEKMSLSERFGLWLSFYPFSQKEYLAVAEGWTKHFGGEISDRWQTEALQFALQRGSRSGRVAYQFARDWAGRMHLETEHDN